MLPLGRPCPSRAVRTPPSTKRAASPPERRDGPAKVQRRATGRSPVRAEGVAVRGLNRGLPGFQGDGRVDDTGRAVTQADQEAGSGHRLQLAGVATGERVREALEGLRDGVEAGDGAVAPLAAQTVAR